MKIGKQLRCTLTVAAALLASACSTTTIQTGGAQYAGQSYADSERSPGDPESRFFNELSDQDAAFAGNPQLAAADCNCQQRAPDGAERSLAERPADNTDSSRSAASVEQHPDTTAANSEVQGGQDSFFSQTTGAVSGGAGALPAASAGDAPQYGDYSQTGVASWYGRDFDGKPTASGELFDSRKLTAAHRSIPLGSIVLVRNLSNNKEVLVTVNDRGPFVEGRVLDLSEYGAELLGYKEQGLARVGIRVVRVGQGQTRSDGATHAFFGAGQEATPPSAQELHAAEVRDEMAMARFYSVQVGLFADLRNARNMERFLQSYGQPIQVLRRGEQYVVKVGQFREREQAEQLKGQLGAEGYSAFISGPIQ
ncbi:MAG: septal ring lytic transglycosylase RlpA family protein [Leptospirales bacterium]|nr:septal ring lytic transglycosylase RlpA family protein [Leptospirales bacterium]